MPSTSIKHSNSSVHANLLVFTGTANFALANDVVAALKHSLQQANIEELNISLGKAAVGRFSDGEIKVEIQENVRGKDVFILQSTSAPTNDTLMELLLISDALRRASVNRITAAIPYFGYARQDRRPRSARVAISAKVIANMLQTVGIDRIVTMDLHADQIQGFFDIPVDNIYAMPILLDDLRQKFQNEEYEENGQKSYKNLMVVSPDIGGVVRARALAKHLNVDLAIIDKRRPEANAVEVMNVIGDVQGRNCIIMDDMVDTAGTLCKAADALKERGAKHIYAYATHPVLSGNAIDNIVHSNLNEVVVTDTILLSQNAKKCSKIRALSSASLLAETFLRIRQGNSVMSLFSET